MAKELPGSNLYPLRHDLTPKPVKVTELKPLGRCTRKHQKSQVRKIARSIEETGLVRPILIDDQKRVIDGEAIVEAVRVLGLTEIPAIRIADLSSSQLRALRLTLNRIPEDGKWDELELASELEELIQIDTTFDLSLTGFDTPEIDVLLAETVIDPFGAALDTVPAPQGNKPAITRDGDLWVLGSHRVLCGDALDHESYKTLLAGEPARLVITDPPYNVPVAGHVSGLGAVKHREFAMASGEMTAEAFTQFLMTALGHVNAHLVNGGVLFVFMDWRHQYELETAARASNLDTLNLCVWVKTNGGMGSLYRSQHELVLVLKNGKAPHVNNVQLGRHGRNRTNVWSYSGVNTFRRDRQEILAMHPTVKPVSLVADAILDCSHRGDIVLDPFAGSGTTVLAAERTRRRGFGIEIDPHYVDLILSRFQTMTGHDAILAPTNETFTQVQARRAETDTAAQGRAQP